MEISALIQGGTALYNTFGKNNPARAAGGELGKIAGYGRDAYNPFIQQGQNAMGQLGPQYSQMAGQPTDFYNQILGQFKPSAGYQYKEDRLNQLGHNTAAAGGYAGTQGDVENRSKAISGLLGEDMQQYLQNILGIQGAGQAGLQRQSDIGFMGAGGLADYLGTVGLNKGNLAANQSRYGNEASTNALGSLAGLIGSKQRPQGQQQPDLMELLSSLFGGGGVGSGQSQLPQGSQMSLNKLNYMSPVSPVAARSGLFSGGG